MAIFYSIVEDEEEDWQAGNKARPHFEFTSKKFATDCECIEKDRLPLALSGSAFRVVGLVYVIVSYIFVG